MKPFEVICRIIYFELAKAFIGFCRDLAMFERDLKKYLEFTVGLKKIV